MWPGFKSRRRRHLSFESVVGSLPCFDRLFSEYYGYPLSSKTNIFKSQFDQESVRRRTTLCGCATSKSLLLLLLLLFLNLINVTWFVGGGGGGGGGDKKKR